MFNKLAPEKPTTDRFMDTILERKACKSHGADIGEPCGRMGPFRAVCNRRARAAGFNHPVSEKSLRRNNFQKR